jgi:hypothetical protein
MSPDEPAAAPLNGALAELVERARAALARGDIPRGELGQADQTQHLQPSLDDELHRSARP